MPIKSCMQTAEETSWHLIFPLPFFVLIKNSSGKLVEIIIDLYILSIHLHFLYSFQDSERNVLNCKRLLNHVSCQIFNFCIYACNAIVIQPIKSWHCSYVQTTLIILLHIVNNISTTALYNVLSAKHCDSTASEHRLLYSSSLMNNF